MSNPVTCPKCGASLHCTIISTNPEHERRQCPACGWFVDLPPHSSRSIKIPKKVSVDTASHVCTICGEREYPGGDIVDTTLWICPECAGRIRKMIYEEGKL